MKILKMALAILVNIPAGWGDLVAGRERGIFCLGVLFFPHSATCSTEIDLKLRSELEIYFFN